ncbi:DUF4365 domain-containing protein [Pseudomonas sp. QL9]|uniref:DUF4365 domain-containing protein n=1 Tax=Pseudomonas sp. QL9 TaxID=3242725 RepID=UPI00352A2A6B
MKEKILPILLDSSLTGEQGVIAVQKIAYKIGFIFRDATKNDFGIDAYLERFIATDTPTKNHVTGRLLAVQIKCGELIARDSGNAYKLSCTEANINYWKGHSLPVIVIYCRPKDEKCFWVIVNDSSLKKAKTNWTLSIPKENDLEHFYLPLTKLADGLPTTHDTPIKQGLTFEFDEHEGLTLQDDEETGVLCSEYIARIRNGEELAINIKIKYEDAVRTKLDNYKNSTNLSLDERKEWLQWSEIDRRYQKKKSELIDGLLAILSSEQIGRTYFWQLDHTAKGRAVRNLFLLHSRNSWSARGALSLDVFPNRKPFEPCIKLSLSQQEKEHLFETADIKEAQMLTAQWGYFAIDLPRDVFNEKLLPGVVFKCQVHAELNSIPVSEYIANLNLPIDSWVIGLS